MCTIYNKGNKIFESNKIRQRNRMKKYTAYRIELKHYLDRKARPFVTIILVKYRNRNT